MVYARIRVSLPEDGWKAGITAEYPDTAVCLSNMQPRNGQGLEVAVLSGEVAETVACTLREHPDTREVAVVQRAGDTVTVQVETVEPILSSAAHRSRAPIAYPVELDCDEAVVDIVSTHERFSAFGAQLEEAGIGFKVTSVQRDGEQCQVLTDRQREVVLAAVEHGYYETPRQCSLTELANELGIAKSTCSGTLQRAEDALVEFFLTSRSLSTRRYWDSELSARELSSS